MAVNTKDILWKMASMLTWRSRRLVSLAEFVGNEPVENASFQGLQAVSLAHIRGSASTGRCQDFDVNFRPTNRHTEARWQGIYQARTKGRGMPPVTLIKVGDIYFVEDGHHRVSVAWALGDEQIEGQVTVWELGESQSVEM